MENNNSFNSNDDDITDLTEVVTENDIMEKDNHNFTNDTNNDAIQQHIDEIKYSPNLKFLVTHSKDEKSIVGWTVDLDKGTIQQDKDNCFKYSKDDYKKDDDSVDIFIGDVSDNKHIILYGGGCYSKQLLIN